jgi:hypothetical protein
MSFRMTLESAGRTAAHYLSDESRQCLATFSEKTPECLISPKPREVFSWHFRGGFGWPSSTRRGAGTRRRSGASTSRHLPPSAGEIYEPIRHVRNDFTSAALVKG